MSVTIVLGDLGQGEIPLPLCTHIAVLNEKIRCGGTVNKQYFLASRLKIVTYSLIRFFFLMLQAGGEGMRRREIDIFLA